MFNEIFFYKSVTLWLTLFESFSSFICSELRWKRMLNQINPSVTIKSMAKPMKINVQVQLVRWQLNEPNGYDSHWNDS